MNRGLGDSTLGQARLPRPQSAISRAGLLRRHCEVHKVVVAPVRRCQADAFERALGSVDVDVCIDSPVSGLLRLAGGPKLGAQCFVIEGLASTPRGTGRPDLPAKGNIPELEAAFLARARPFCEVNTRAA
jgi:hypothetical protein